MLSVESPDRSELAGGVDQTVLAGWRALKRGHGSDLVTEVIDVYLTETPVVITAIQAAIKDGDAGVLEQSAHRCAGSSGNVGARRLCALCNQLEALGCAGITAGAEELFVHLQAEYAQVKEALELVREQGRAVAQPASGPKHAVDLSSE